MAYCAKHNEHYLTEHGCPRCAGMQKARAVVAERVVKLHGKDRRALAAAQARIEELEGDRDDNRRLYTRLARAVHDGHPVNMAFVDDLQSLALQRGQAEQREQALREALGNAADLLEKLGYFGDADKARKALAEKGDTHG